MLLWAVCGLVAACGALCYAECGARLPRTGGFYVFYREVYGEPLAFVGGWAALLVTYPASIAAIAVVLSRHLRDFLPAPALVLGAAAVFVSGVLNVTGVRAGARGQTALTVAKVGALTLVCAAALLGRRESVEAVSAPAAAGSLLTAFVVLLWTYDGWSDVTLVAGEVRDPRRNLPRTVFAGIGCLVVLYLIVQAAVSALIPAASAAASMSPVADAARIGLGATGGRIVGLLVVLATFGAIHGVVLTASRLGYAMARDGVFLGWFGALSPWFGTPARSTGALVAASLFYVVFGDFQNLLAYFTFSVWIFYGLTAVAVLRLRKRRVGEETGAPPTGALGPAAPFVVLATAAGMTASLAAQDPKRAAIGAGMLLAGFPAYAIWKRLRRP